MIKIALLLFVVLSAQYIAYAAYVRHERSRVYLEGKKLAVPENWIKSDLEVNSDESVPVVIGLKIQNEESLLEKFWSVSDPDNSDYGKYMTLSEIASLIAPSESNIALVRAWLLSHGLTEIATVVTKDYLTVIAPVKVVEEMFQVVFRYFDNTKDGRSILRSQNPYSIPAELSQAIDIVIGLTNFPATARPMIQTSKRSVRQFAPPVYPNNIKKVLHVGTVIGSGRADNIQSVVQFDNQYYDPADLSYFLNYFRLPDQNITNLIGFNDPMNAGEEATLDVQYIVGIGTNVSTWMYSIPNNNQSDPFLDWLLLMSNETQIPSVISVSYGGPEASWTLQIMSRTNVEFVKAGLRGATILFASGDSGVGCTANCTAFVPNWPASSPYVTAVGGIILDSETPFKVEGDSISGGGFSSFFGRPKYQQNAVANYIAKNKLPPTSYYNISGRGIPDLAAFSENVIVFMGEGEIPAVGTSCAAPITAGILSLVNDALLAKGKPTLGFFNPLLYKITTKNPKAIYDVATGSNSDDCCPGFRCAAGWDPVTGLGVTMFEELRDAVLAYL